MENIWVNFVFEEISHEVFAIVKCMTPWEIICVSRQDLCFHAMEGRVFAQKCLLKENNVSQE